MPTLKKAVFLAAMMLFVSPIFGQTTATIIDSDSTAWAGGTYQVNLVTIPQGVTPYRSDTGQNITTAFSGTLDGTGSFSVTLTPISVILPKGLTWQFTVCPNVSSATCGTVNIPVQGSGSVSSQINAVITAPRISGGRGSYAYADVEVAGVANNSYFNVTSSTLRCYGSSWGACGSGAGGPPTGAAGGVLSGTYPNPGAADPLITGKVVNGISYSVNYSHTSGLAAAIDACAQDALHGTNGNTSGVCDSTGEVNTQTDNSGTSIVIGDSTGDAMTWIHPALCHWSFSGNYGGTGDVIDLYGGSSIEGPTPVNNPCEIKYTGAGGAANAVLQALDTAGGNSYFKVKGMGFFDQGPTLTSGATMVINSSSDGSIFEDLLVVNYVAGENAILLNDAVNFGQCCTTTFNRVVANGNYVSGPILKIVGTFTNLQEGVTFSNVSLTHPAPGNPVILCSSPNPSESLYFENLYEEPNNTDTTTAVNIVTGCRSIKVSGMSLIVAGAATPISGPIWQLNASSGTTAISFDLSSLTAQHGFALPAIAVQNNILGFNCNLAACNYMTDSNGNTPHISLGTPQADLVNSQLGYEIAGSPLVPAGTIGDMFYASSPATFAPLSKLAANQTASSEVLVSPAASSTPSPSTSTCSAFNGVPVFATHCAWSTPPVAGQTIACGIRVGTSGNTLTVTDSAGNVYSPIGSVISAMGGTNNTQTYYFGPIQSSITTNTIRSSVIDSEGIQCNAIAAGVVSSALDGQCSIPTTSASGTFSCASSGGTGALVTTSNKDYIFCAGTGTVSLSAGAGFTLGNSSSHDITQYQIQSTAGSLTPAMSGSGSPNTMTCTAFKTGPITATPVLQNAPALSAANMTGYPVATPSIFGVVEPDNTTITATGGVISAVSGSSVNWPTTGDVVISTSSINPGGVAPINGDCLLGAGGAWTAGSCGGTAPTFYGGTSTGSANVQTITLSGSPTLSSLIGVPITFLPGFANTTTTPTLQINSLTATTIVKGSSAALASSDVVLNAMAVVVYDGTNFVLQNPQSLVTQIGASGSFGLTGSNAFKTQNIISNAATASLNIQSGNDGGNATEGILTLRGGATSSATGTGGNAVLEAGAATSTANNTGMVQGFANVQQSFKVVSALSATFEAVAITTTADVVQASPLGGVTNLGIAQTVGASNGQLFVVSHGKTTTRFDGTPVIGDFACAPPASTGTIGLAHDNGSTACPNGQQIGLVTGQVSGTGSGATATVLLEISPPALNSGISGLTANYIPKAGSATTITANSAIDDGVTTVGTITSTEPVVAPSFTASGTASGYAGLTAGSSVTAAPTSTVLITVPTSVTAYGLELPGAQPTSGNTAISCTAANPSVCTWGGSTISPKVENGISKCDQYSGTPDAKFNACVVDAETHANGNTSGIADMRGMGGAQNFVAFVSCGDASSDPVTVLMPAEGTWTFSAQGSSTHYDINYYTGCTMLGTSAQPTGLVIDHTAANGNSLAVMGPGPGITGAGYVNIGGFSLQANSTTLITNAVLIISGADNTIFHDMNINHYSGGEEGISTNGPNATGICCQATLKNITVNGQYSGGANLDLVASNSLVLQGLSLVNVSLDHPATPAPNFKCTSTSSGNSSVEFHGLYEETNHTLNATTLNTISACTGVMIDGFYPNDVAGSGTTTMISTTNAVNTNLVVTAMQPTNFNYGGIFVANGFTGVNTLFNAAGGWSYFQQPFIGNAQAGYVIASGSISDSTPVLGAILEASGGNCYGLRFGASASVVTSDMKECLFSGLLGFYNSSTRLMTLNQSTGELAGISSAAIDGFGSINVPVIQGQAYQQNAVNNTAGKCTMATATSCTQTITHTYTTPVCIVTQQSATLTGGAAGCTVSGTTVTVTSAVANTETWGFWVFGDPN